MQLELTITEIDFTNGVFDADCV